MSKAVIRTLVIIAALAFAMPASAQQEASSVRLGIDVAGMDRTVRPQDDFFRFVNGAWYDRAEIPAEMSSYGSFIILRDKAAADLRAIIENAAAQQNAPGSIMQKVGDFYLSYMDSVRIESLGIKPLQIELTEISKIKSRSDLPVAFAQMSRIGVRTPFATGVQQDPKNSQVYAVITGQSGLTMGDRDYYLRPDEKFVAIRKAYTDYVTQLFTLAGQPDPQGAAQRILALETAIAQKQWDRARARDRNAIYNKMTATQLATSSPSFDWQVYLTALAGKPIDEIIVRQPDFVTAADALLNSTPISTWKEYLTLGLLHAYADNLPRAFGDAQFNFTGRVISGRQEIRPRWKRAVSEVERALGEAVGKLYVEEHFAPPAKARMDGLVRNLLAAFKVGIDELEWMSPATRAQAQDKLSKFKVKIGYPERWREFNFDVDRNDLIGNVMRSRRFQSEEAWERLGRAVERWRMGMTPQTVNASYNSVNNEITFPAGILQPPFFNMEADDAVNYGAIGAVIGHEISHGFDDQGRKSDGDGNLRDWWTPEDAKKFEQLADKLGAQFAKYSPIEGMTINPRLTMGENIGDLSGLAVAYRAYRMSLNGKEAPVIDGFTGDQRFFMGWAQVWRYKAREPSLRNQLLTDSHSPGMYRAFVPLTNFDPFYAAFNVQPGDKMWRDPQDRVKIW